MWKHLFQNLLNRIKKNKLSSFLRVVGLCLAFVAVVLIAQYLLFENSYDQFHTNHKNIYRVESKFLKNGEITDSWATSSPGYGPAIAQAFEEVNQYTRIIFNDSERLIQYKETIFREKNVCWVDSNFFEVFDFELIKGTKNDVLNKANTMVVSASAARKLFGEEDPVGKSLKVSNFSGTLVCEVRGVYKDMPKNSSIQLDYMVSALSAPKWMHNFWYLHEAYTFVELQDNHDPAKIEAQFPALAEQYKTEAALKDKTWAVELVGLSALHLSPVKAYAQTEKNDPRLLKFLFMALVVVLFLGWFNETNMGIILAMKRRKESVLRKVMGAGNGNLFWMSFIDSLVHQLLAAVGSFVLVFFSWNAGWLPMGYDFIQMLVLLALLVVVGAVLCGAVPFLVLSSVVVSEGINGVRNFSVGGKRTGQGIVIIQMACTLTIVSLTFISWQQLSFMKAQKKGVDTDQILVVQSPKEKINALRYGSFKNTLLQIQGVEAFTGSNAVPGMEIATFYANRRAESSEESTRLFEMLKADFNFSEVYGLQFVQGRNFNSLLASDSSKVVLNQEAVQHFGFVNDADAIGKKVLLETSNDPKEVIGVLQNYHHESFHKNFSPIVLQHDPQLWWIPKQYFSLKLSTTNHRSVVEAVEEVWQKSFPNASFDYFFNDAFYAKQYESENRYNLYFSIFSFLAIGVALFGVAGQTMLHVEHKTKELSIRKVLGATVVDVVRYLYLWAGKLLLFAVIISVPLSQFISEIWMEQYAKKMNITPFVFGMPVFMFALVFTVVLLKIILKSAFTNPAKVLKES